MQHQCLLYDDIFTTQERTKKFKNGFREQSVRDLLRPNLRSAEEEDEDEEDADPIRVSQRRRLASRDAKNRNEETSYSGRNRCVRARDEEEEKGGCRAREGIVAGCKPLVKKIRSVRVDILCCCKFISCIVIYSSTSCAYVRAITISAEEEEAFVFVVVVAVVVVVAAAAAAAAVVVAEVKICSQR